MLNTDILIFRHLSQRTILTLDCSLHDLLLIQYTPDNSHDLICGWAPGQWTTAPRNAGHIKKKDSSIPPTIHDQLLWACRMR